MQPTAYRNLMLGQALCTFYFGLMLTMARIEGAGVQGFCLTLLTASAASGIGLILTWRRRLLGTLLGAPPMTMLALLILGAAASPLGLAR